MTKIKVNENSKKDWTKITFKPDLKRFAGMTILNADIVALMTKRVHDIAATNAGLKVTLNGTIFCRTCYGHCSVMVLGGAVGSSLSHA